MAIGKRRFLKWLRVALAVIAIAFGLLAVWSGLAGSEPIRIGFGKHHFYQLVVVSAALWWLWGILGLVTGILLAFPSLVKRKRR